MSDQKDFSEGFAFVFIVFLVLAIIGISWLSKEHVYFWYYLKWPLVKAYYYIPEEIKPYLFFWIEKIDYFKVGSINTFINNLNDFFDKGVEVVATAHKEGTFNVSKVSTVLSYMYLPFIIPVLIYASVKSLSIKHFNNTFDMNAFRLQESEIWPVIKPILNVNEKEINDLDNGKWAMSIRPELVFFKKENFFTYIDEDGDDYKLKRKDKSLNDLDKNNVKFKLNYDAFYDFFLEQLGDPWSGYEDLTEDEQQLFCILIAKASRSSGEAQKLIDLLGNYYSTLKGLKAKKERNIAKKTIDKMMKEIVSKYLETDIIQDVINKHHFKQTVFSGMLLKAREDGVLSNGQFIWIKPLNRDLWYNMVSIGRKLPFADAAGIWSHFLYEQAINSAISLPKIENAVKSVDDYFSTRYYNYITFDELEKKDEGDD